jgi:hypothetical protein
MARDGEPSGRAAASATDTALVLDELGVLEACDAQTAIAFLVLAVRQPRRAAEAPFDDED